MEFSNLKYFGAHLIEQFNTSNFKRNDEDWYFFIHIPKTAGTTFRFLIYDHFPQTEIYPNYFEYMVRQNSKYITQKEFIRKWNDLFPMTKRWLFGHYQFSLVHQIPGNRPKTLSIFRDPVRRVKSSIIYHQLRGRRYAGMTVKEVIEKHGKEEGIKQARLFGYQPRKKNLDEAIAAIDQLDYVGLTEYFAESVELANRLFNFSLKYNSTERNKGSYDALAFDTEDLQRINEVCHIDQMIYDHARKRFIHLCRKHHVDLPPALTSI